MIYSNLWIALAALTMTWQTQLLLTNRFFITEFTVFVFCATLLLYAVHRLINLQKSAILQQQARFITITSFQRVLQTVGFLSVIIVIFLFFKFDAWLQLALCIPIFCAAGYALPILPGQKRLRDINFLKNVLIAGVWTWITVVLPVLELQMPVNQGVVLMGVGRFCFIFALSLAFDVRDVNLDQQSQVRTIPVAIGILKTKIIAFALIAITFICVSINWLSVFYNFNDWLGISITLIITYYLIANAAPEKPDFYYAGLLDGTMILQFLLVWLL
ncbi:MAG: hypothetical protein ACK4TA_15135 [Saprospiraceae bacterium]